MRTIQNRCEECVGKLPPKEQERVRSATIQYWCLALAGEIGELCNLVKKEVRDEIDLKERISEEMADILIYLCMMANSLEVDLEKEYYRKQEKNMERFRHS